MTKPDRRSMPIKNSTIQRNKQKNNISNKNKSKQENLKIMYANADSIRNKREEFEAFIIQHDIDIALICESLPKRTSEDKPSSPFIIKGFDYIENNEGRGVIVYFRETLNIKLIDDINSIYSPSLYFKVTSAKKPIHVAITYRSPNISKEADECFNKQIKSAIKQLKNLKYDLWRL